MEADMTVFEKVQGKRVDVDYESGDHYVIDYLSESELRWNALSEVGGEPSSEVDPYDAVALGEDVYMVNWIEEAGVVASQVADFGNGRVTTFLTCPEEGAHGGRGKMVLEGRLTLVG